MAFEGEACAATNLHIVSRPTGFEVEDHHILCEANDSGLHTHAQRNNGVNRSTYTLDDYGRSGQINGARDAQKSSQPRTFRYYGQPMDSKHRNKGSYTKVVISSSVKDIPDEAFSEWMTLEHVLLEYPSQLQHIGDQAFFGCTSLTSIVYHDDDDDDDDEANGRQHAQLPETLTTIGDGAFYKCIRMEKFSLPLDSSRLLRVGRTAFGCCERLESMDLPDSVEQLGAMALSGCDSLRRVRLSKGLVEIEERTFWRCSSLTEIIIPPSVQMVGVAAFGECYRLERVRLPVMLERLEDSLFDHCTRLVTIDYHDFDDDDSDDNDVPLSGNSDTQHSDGVVVSKTPRDSTSDLRVQGRSCSYATNSSAKSKGSHSTATTSATTTSGPPSPSSFWDDNCFLLPPYLKSIGDETFAGCHKMQSIALPPTIQSIGNFAFDGCRLLEEVALPESTKHVGDGCFRDCKRLETVRMAFDSDVVFGSAAFSGCTSMKELFDPRNEAIVYI
jgi:hypothetical protein